LDFNIKKNPLIKKEEEQFLKDELDIAYNFSLLIKKEMQDFIKSIVLFGSTARKRKDSKDIDILIIIDDLSVEFNKAIIQGYRIISQNIIQKVSNRLHVTSMRLTNFWEYVRSGDPIAVNILRDGVAIVDSGIFNPVKLLLYQGRIKPSQESITNYISRAQYSIISAKNHLLAACIDLYWAAIDAAESALMKVNEIPPGPSHVHNLIDKRFVNTGIIEKNYSIILQELYHLNKAIEHKEIKEITGEQFSKYCHNTEEFVKCMRNLIEKN